MAQTNQTWASIAAVKGIRNYYYPALDYDAEEIFLRVEVLSGTIYSSSNRERHVYIIMNIRVAGNTLVATKGAGAAAKSMLQPCTGEARRSSLIPCYTPYWHITKTILIRKRAEIGSR